MRIVCALMGGCKETRSSSRADPSRPFRSCTYLVRIARKRTFEDGPAPDMERRRKGGFYDVSIIANAGHQRQSCLGARKPIKRSPLHNPATAKERAYVGYYHGRDERLAQR
jgi:hypothetical protein